ncbi:hypothetical protein EZV77_06935 [Burkholderia thailandensis]|nr:hypothetical protein CWD92_11855 [Burkholderia thailandensis]TBW66417.1 hypothetical protein EZV77_06935 [Burkholderia thailandensis]
MSTDSRFTADDSPLAARRSPFAVRRSSAIGPRPPRFDCRGTSSFERRARSAVPRASPHPGGGNARAARAFFAPSAAAPFLPRARRVVYPFRAFPSHSRSMIRPA